MPDAGAFGHRDPPTPMRWGDAFAALPLESAGTQAWERLQARLPARAIAPARSRGRWLPWLAAAASLAVVVAVPWRLQTRHATTAPAGSPPAPVIAARQPEPLQTPVEENAASRVRHARDTAPPARAIATAGTRSRAPAASPERNLEPLYAESARLEELLALTRDDRVANGGFAALADDCDAELAVIDAALIQPDLEAPRRAELWHQRVDTLRQLAGIETTRRLLAARGETWDAALVSVD